MYRKGDVELMLAEDPYWHLTDAREDDGYDVGRPKHPFAYLPHSCDEWIIGGPEQIKAMIADLEAALEALGATPS